MFFFRWLSDQVKNAVLAGIADAVSELDASDDHTEAAALLRQRLQALPAPAEPAVEEEAHTGNGRKRKASAS